eukprot:3236204-Rhodomonas_salina.2
MRQASSRVRAHPCVRAPLPLAARALRSAPAPPLTPCTGALLVRLSPPPLLPPASTSARFSLVIPSTVWRPTLPCLAAAGMRGVKPGAPPVSAAARSLQSPAALALAAAPPHPRRQERTR